MKRAVLLLSIASLAATVQAQRWNAAAVRLDTVRLPAGFSIAEYADVPGARSMTLAPDGTVFVGTWGNTVHAVVDRNHDGRAEEVITLADGLQLATGVAVAEGSLFVADVNRVLRYDDVLDFVRN